jgi:hypothetical protein
LAPEQWDQAIHNIYRVSFWIYIYYNQNRSW